jgi:hypothetical protein
MHQQRLAFLQEAYSLYAIQPAPAIPLEKKKPVFSNSTGFFVFSFLQNNQNHRNYG